MWDTQTQTLAQAQKAVQRMVEKAASGGLVLRPAVELEPLMAATEQQEEQHEELMGGALEGELNRSAVCLLPL